MCMECNIVLTIQGLKLRFQVRARNDLLIKNTFEKQHFWLLYMYTISGLRAPRFFRNLAKSRGIFPWAPGKVEPCNIKRVHCSPFDIFCVVVYFQEDVLGVFRDRRG